MLRFYRQCFILAPLTALLLLAVMGIGPWVASSARAGQVTLAWDPNSESNIAGYRIHYGTQSGSYEYSVDVKNETSCTISGLQEGSVYYFAATAYDSRNNESDYSEELVHTISSGPAIEIGEVLLNHQWRRVDFQQSFVDPVVVARALSSNGSDPAVIRIRNVQPDGFEMRVQEWDYLDGPHAQESVGYLVMERGSYTLDDGTLVEAGRFETAKTGSFGAVAFIRPFQEAPVVLTAVTSANEQDAVTGRTRRISTQGFEFCMQEQESNAKAHRSEIIDYIAWEPATGTVGQLEFEVGKTPDAVKHKFFSVQFEPPFQELPVFLAGMQSADGMDTANVRWRSKAPDSVEIQIDEEQSKNTETRHTREVVGYFVFAAAKQ